MTIDEIDYWNEYFYDKIKHKNQPTLHLFKNIENSFPKSMQTFYNYIHKGYFTFINDEMLPRAYSYKPRTRTNEKPVIRLDNVIRTGRMNILNLILIITLLKWILLLVNLKIKNVF